MRRKKLNELDIVYFNTTDGQRLGLGASKYRQVIGKSSAAKRAATTVANGAQPQIVKFFKMGDLSPKKKVRDALPVKQAFASKDGLNKWSNARSNGHVGQ
jgi:hypothetical protein